jgi:dipeptidyl aminopeptidase/acylaminoacyl peptidase
MTNRQQLPYGSWPSPVDAEALVSGASVPTDTWAEDGVTWWSQTRPDQGGRIQVVRRDTDGGLHDALPDGWNVRTRVHEYGGGAWWVDGGTVFATSWTDQRLYRADPGHPPVALTAEPPVPHGFRYADGRITPDGSTLVCVREDHTPADGDDERMSGVRNEIIALAARPAEAGPAEPVVLVTGHDFVAAPRISPDGRRLAWLTWEHPDMPWDATRLWVADLIADGVSSRLDQVRQVAGAGPAEESLVQPTWSPTGELYVVSDRSNWWNVYRVDGLDSADGRPPTLLAVHPIDAEVGRPAWQFGQSQYVVGSGGTAWLTYSAAGGAHLVQVDRDGTAQDDTLPYSRLAALRLDGNRLVALATSPDAEPAVISLPVGAGPAAASDTVAPAVAVLRAPRDLASAFGLGSESISRPRRVSFSSNGRTAHAWLYLPANAEAEAQPQERPPLLVAVHGGPTGAADPSFRLDLQFWTTRGFAVADVDYGGSTGYGRTYRRLLDAAWGIADVEDVCAAARWLAEQDLVDGRRMVVRGGSAGGYTTLLALAVTDVFAAGASHFGVADLGALARDTHKFESHYLDRLIGPWPEAEAVYTERSPLRHVHEFDRPLIVLQGDEDTVVPPAQAELIVSALRTRQVPHAYLLFAGEQHGFRTAENIVAAAQAELSFYGQVFGFTPAGEVPRVRVEFADRLTDRRPESGPASPNRTSPDPIG